MHLQKKRPAICIDQGMSFAAFHLLAGVEAAWAAAFRGLHRLAVNHGGRWTGFAADTLAVEHDQLVAQTLPQTFVAKADEPAIGRLMRREMLGQLPPGTTAAQDIENRVQHFTHWPNTTAACLGRWEA